MVRTIVVILALGVLPAALKADEQTPPSSEPRAEDRGYIQMDACFGDKYETDDDLKTGNELAVQEALKLLLNPGT